MVDKLSAGESMEEDCETIGRIGGGVAEGR